MQKGDLMKIRIKTTIMRPLETMFREQMRHIFITLQAFLQLPDELWPLI